MTIPFKAIQGALKSVGIFNVDISEDYIEKELGVDLEGKSFVEYTHIVTIPTVYFINRQDSWDVYQVYSKLVQANEYLAERVKHCQIKLKPFKVRSSNDNTVKVIVRYIKE